MLTVRGLRKRFVSDSGTVVAVANVNLHVERGEFYTLLGPSGCGKTTTLQCLAGIETPDEGEIELDGQLVYSSARHVMVPGHKRDLGMVFQNYAIWPHLTVFENVAFPLLHGRRKVPRAEVAERVHRALDLVQLDSLAGRAAPFLSGGQQQRVALARAIVHEPKLLLLDEPLSNLDAKLRESMRTELSDLVKRLEITTVYVTHDQVEALSMSDRIAVMRDGRMVQEGSPRELYLAPRDTYIAGFLGKTNLIQGEVTADGTGAVSTRLGVLPCSAPEAFAGRQSVVIGVRPEAIEIWAERPSATHVIEGMLERTTFVGNCVECWVRVGDDTLLVHADPALPLHAGSRVYVRIPPDRCVVMGGTPEPDSESIRNGLAAAASRA